MGCPSRLQVRTDNNTNNRCLLWFYIVLYIFKWFLITYHPLLDMFIILQNFLVSHLDYSYLTSLSNSPQPILTVSNVLGACHSCYSSMGYSTFCFSPRTTFSCVLLIRATQSLMTLPKYIVWFQTLFLYHMLFLCYPSQMSSMFPLPDWQILTRPLRPSQDFI